MRIKFTKGSSPLNLVKYLLDEQKQQQGQAPEIDTNLFGKTAIEMAEEFRFSHALNLRVKQTMGHFSISLTPGERVDRHTRHRITQRLLELTGHGDCQYLSAEHFDQIHKHDVQHWHVGLSNVDLDGNHVEDDYLRVRLRQIEQQLEREFDLVQTQLQPECDRTNIPTGEYRRKQRTGEILPRERLWQTIKEQAADEPPLPILTARLKTAGVGVRFRASEDEIQGISYELDDWTCSGSKLGDAYSFGGLQEHLNVSYDPTQASELLRLQQMTAQQCQEWLRVQQEEQQRDQERQQQIAFYRDRYWHYAPKKPMQPRQRDQAVAAKALTDRQTQDTVEAILACGSEQAETIRQEQGTEAAIHYVQQLVAVVAVEMDKRQQPELDL